MEANERPKKRQKRNSGNEEKKQGRPRAGPKDETAVQRRRTQIRLAQRAYRQRKDSTIDELRNQVDELSSKAELMNKALRDFVDRAISRNLPRDLMSDLEDLVSRFASDKAVVPRSTSESSSDQGRVMRTLNAVDTTVEIPRTSQQGLIETQPPSRTIPEPIPIGLGYFVMYENANREVLEATSSNSDDDDSASRAVSRSTAASTPPDSFNSTPSPISSFKPRFVYSVDEWSFGRRIHRRCMERGFQLLSHPDRAPYYYHHVFRLAMRLGRDNQECRRRFQITLLKSIHDNLESDTSPYTSIGGAGSHFPSQHRAIRYPTAEEKSFVNSFMNGISGFEGEWFDSGDVEGYLAMQGIHIDPRSSYVDVALSPAILSTPPPADLLELTEVNHIDADLEECETYHLRKHLTSNKTQSPGANPLGVPTADTFDFSLTNMTDLLYPAVGFSDAQTGSFFNFNVEDSRSPSTEAVPGPFGPQSLDLTTSVNTTLPYAPTMSPMYNNSSPMSGHGIDTTAKIPVTIDVAKLVKNLTLNALCLGRGPGFRRADVDRALRASVLAVF